MPKGPDPLGADMVREREILEHRLTCPQLKELRKWVIEVNRPGAS